MVATNFCYTAWRMWFPFKKRKKVVQLQVAVPRPRRAMKRLIVGFIIGGAISSIIGTAMMHKKKDDETPDEDDRDGKED